jgi:hypothetical protein
MILRRLLFVAVSKYSMLHEKFTFIIAISYV